MITVSFAEELQRLLNGIMIFRTGTNTSKNGYGTWSNKHHKERVWDA